MSELNAYLAEKVMGWLRVDSPARLDHADRFFWNKGDVLIHKRQNEITNFNPATNHADAMLVLMEIAIKKHWPSFTPTRGSIVRWIYTDPTTLENKTVDTLPLAICLMAKLMSSK